MKNRRGNDQHEKLLKTTIADLKKEGYNAIDLCGKSPTLIATKDNRLIAVKIMGRVKTPNGWKKDDSNISVETIYKMFDDVKIECFKRYVEKREDVVEAVIAKYQSNGYKVIKMEMKSPDAIATKNNKIYAIEILGIEHVDNGECMGNKKNWTQLGKRTDYARFDGLMIKTFKYGDISSRVVTETFGKDREPEFYKPKSIYNI